MRKIFIISNIIMLPNPIAVGLSFAVFPNVKNNKISIGSTENNAL